MKTKPEEKPTESIERTKWCRDTVASNIVDFEKAKEKQSQRQFALGKGISRSTLQHWLSRKESIDAAPQYIDFFESSLGAAFLHRIVTAAHFVFTKHGNASRHNISEFLKLSGLEEFIATSYSTHRGVSNTMDDAIIEFGEAEQKKLAADMPFKQIALAEDETFHPEVCLVAMEPVSNFIMVEQYAENRKSETWNAAVSEGIKELPVEVIQVASDEGRSLINHAADGLGVHHSSDCFHVAQEISKGTNGALASAVKNSQKEYDSAKKERDSEIKRKEKYENQTVRPCGRPPNFEKKIETASDKVKEAESKLSKTGQNQEIVRESKKEIGQNYHPYNLETGEKQDGKKVGEFLEGCFDRIDKAVEGLSDRCKQRVDKAHRVLKKLIANIVFFFHMIEVYMNNMDIGEHEKELMRNYLIPSCYLAQAAEKERDKEKKAHILEKSQQLLDLLNSRDGPILYCTQEQITKLKTAAKEYAQIFQRSSSCVEGRNAQLSLKHHGMHKLNDKQLSAQTVIHNFWVKRLDDTTSAERFFGAKHNDLFSHLLEKMDYPARPRKHLAQAA